MGCDEVCAVVVLLYKRSTRIFPASLDWKGIAADEVSEEEILCDIVNLRDNGVVIPCISSRCSEVYEDNICDGGGRVSSGR